MNLSKNKLKYYSSLKRKKSREAEGKFIVEGFRGGKDLIDSDFQIEAVFALETFTQSELAKHAVKSKNAEVYSVSEKELRKICDAKTPQGIAFAVFKKDEKIDDNAKIITALYDISDPGNTGTIIRNCDWFGIKNLLISGESAEIYNPKTVRASMGSFFRLNLEQTKNFIPRLRQLKEKGYKLLCADLDGKSVYEYVPPEKSVLIFSNEALGPSEEILELADDVITIPRFGSAESLNVANSAAVIFSEFAGSQLRRK